MDGSAWSGRFAGEGGSDAVSFTASIGFDRRLYPQDIRASMAHARMLAAVGVLDDKELQAILTGLTAIREELDEGRFSFRLAAEDIHMNIERRLIELVGSVGGKLHTGRSRNDQVATDVHLFVKERVEEVLAGLHRLQAVVVQRAEELLGVPMPGYTHLQRAQPVLVSHHLLAYGYMLERDRRRFLHVHREADCLPLGAGALAGSTFPLDPGMVARELGFSRTYANSMDAVSDRDFVLDFLYAGAVLLMHVSRLAGELVLWSSHEFGFVAFDDAYATGSSIMPQKKNPDVAELARGKTGRAYGNLVGLLTVLKGLPLAYHSDLQEDKERLFDTVDTLTAVLPAMTGALETLDFHTGRLTAAVTEDLATATDLADWLAAQGVPFREAHAAVGRLVREALATDRRLDQLTDDELVAAAPALQGQDLDAVRDVLTPEQSIARRRTPGGTAPERVEESLLRLAARLQEREDSGLF